MSSIEVKNAENEKKLKRVKSFAVPCLLLNWGAIVVSLWAIFSGNGFMAIGGEFGSLILGFFAVSMILVMAIMGCVRVKTCINIYKLDNEGGEFSKKYNVKSEDKRYMMGLAYLDRMGETNHLFIGMAILILFLGGIFGGPNAYASHVWAIVLVALAFAYIFPSVYWKIVCNSKCSFSFLLDFLVDLLKIGLIVVLIVIAKSVGAKKEIAVLEISTQYSNIFPSNADPRFFALTLETLRALPKVIFVLMICFMLFAPLEELTEKKAKKTMIWGIILMAIDLVLFMFIPSTYSIMDNIGRWLDQARLWWIPLILLLIALQVSNKFPTGKDIYDDIRQALKKGELAKAAEKAETEETRTEDTDTVE